MSFLVSNYFSEEEEAYVNSCIWAAPTEEKASGYHVYILTGGYQYGAYCADCPGDKHWATTTEIIREERYGYIANECSEIGEAADQIDYVCILAEILWVCGKWLEIVIIKAEIVLSQLFW